MTLSDSTYRDMEINHYVDGDTNFWYVCGDLRRNNDEDNYDHAERVVSYLSEQSVLAKDDSEYSCAFINTQSREDAERVVDALYELGYMDPPEPHPTSIEFTPAELAALATSIPAIYNALSEDNRKRAGSYGPRADAWESACQKIVNVIEKG